MADKIEQILEEWGLKLKEDMQKSIDKAVTHGGGQTSRLSGSVVYEVQKTNSGYRYTLSMNDYWRFVDKGRGATKNMGDGAVKRAVSKLWQNLKGVDARAIIIEINRKRGIKLSKKGLNYDRATKQLAYLISRKIHTKGIKPRPFYDRVVTEERIDELKSKLAKAFKDDFIIDIKQSI